MRTLLIAPLLALSFALTGCSGETTPTETASSMAPVSTATMSPDGTLKSAPGAETKPGPSTTNSLSGQYTTCLEDNGMVFPREGKDLTAEQKATNEVAQDACKAILEKVTKP